MHFFLKNKTFKRNQDRWFILKYSGNFNWNDTTVTDCHILCFTMRFWPPGCKRHPTTRRRPWLCHSSTTKSSRLRMNPTIHTHWKDLKKKKNKQRDVADLTTFNRRTSVHSWTVKYQNNVCVCVWNKSGVVVNTFIDLFIFFLTLLGLGLIDTYSRERHSERHIRGISIEHGYKYNHKRVKTFCSCSSVEASETRLICTWNEFLTPIPLLFTDIQCYLRPLFLYKVDFFVCFFV